MKIVKDFNIKEYSQKLIDWLSDTCMNYPAEGFIIGLSDGIDSAVAASLAVKIGLSTTALILPKKQSTPRYTRCSRIYREN